MRSKQKEYYSVSLLCYQRYWHSCDFPTREDENIPICCPLELFSQIPYLSSELCRDTTHKGLNEKKNFF